MKILIADDEALARLRLRTLLQDCQWPGLQITAEADHAAQVLEQLGRQPIDAVFLDIQMPGNGMTLAQVLQQRFPDIPVVFVTAHAEHAVQAFDVQACDYLTKPVRLERLRECLQRLSARCPSTSSVNTQAFVLIHDRHGSHRVALQDVVYFKAELKYLTVRTVDHSHLLEASLHEFEDKYPELLLRIHRNALVARHCLLGLHRQGAQQEDEGWQVQLRGVHEMLNVSRRQLPVVRQALHKIGT
jgi:two-component system, LytTR family, response regulator AlgR